MYEKLCEAVVPWVGRRFLGLTITVFPNGSGDTTFSYVLALCFLVLATVGAVLWSVLAFAMLSYGFAKVFKMQFPFPAPDRLGWFAWRTGRPSASG